jgi:uncharacterized protein (TIGR00296 family)
MHLTSAQGAELVRLARSTLDSYVSKEERPKVSRWTGYLGEKRGAFVTLNLLPPEGEGLRGCIGFPYPVKELGEAVVEATIGAASEDPRFPPVQPSELTRLLVEVSALTKPETIKVGRRSELPSTIAIGTDGLIISTSYQSGLLLPQVAVEFGLKPTDFLTEACIKAGLPPDSWLLDGVNVQKFQAEVFAEAVPRGAVRAVALK